MSTGVVAPPPEGGIKIGGCIWFWNSATTVNGDQLPILVFFLPELQMRVRAPSLAWTGSTWKRFRCCVPDKHPTSLFTGRDDLSWDRPRYPGLIHTLASDFTFKVSTHAGASVDAATVLSASVCANS